LKQNGVDPKDMQTTGLNVAPKYIYPKDKAPELIGFTTSYTLNVTVRKLDDMGTVLDGLVANGANSNMGVSFGCSDPDKLMDQARLKAAQDARKKADLYASGLGVGVGLVQSISEGAGYTPVRYEFEAKAAPAARDAALAIAAGEQEMSVQLTVVFAVNNVPTVQPRVELAK
ncbi:MAG TPA: SIMPL domain-containing protein, partial [Gemmataceae bacterium]|nr:SIMPL domain-containing protein [Gemmataceae bacterium]